MSFNYNDIENKSKRFTYRGKSIGVLEGDVLKKELSASKHMLRSPKGWAIQNFVLNEAEQIGAKFICIHELEEDTCFWATVGDFKTKGYSFDRGYGGQTALPIRYWQKLKPGKIPAVQIVLPLGVTV